MAEATQPIASSHLRLISWKRVVFLLLGVLTAVTIYEHETPLLNPANPEWAHIAPFRWWLAPHILTAAVALVVGPLQFSATLRRRSMTLHRWLGRSYIIAVLVASAIALYIGIAFEVPENRWLMGSMVRVAGGTASRRQSAPAVDHSQLCADLHFRDHAIHPGQDTAGHGLCRCHRTLLGLDRRQSRAARSARERADPVAFAEWLAEWTSDRQWQTSDHDA